MLPTQAQKPLQQKPQETPWHKKWWAAPVLGAGALGAGYLADKLVNDGKITSSLLSSTKPENPPADRFSDMLSKGRNWMPIGETDAPIISNSIEKPLMAAGGLTGATYLGNGLLNVAGKAVQGAPWGSAAISRIAPKVLTPIAPVVDFHIGSDKFYGDGMSHLLGVSPETGQKISGGIGAGIGAVGNFMPAVGVGATGLLEAGRNIGNKWQEGINFNDAASHNSALIHKTMLDAVRNSDMATLQKIKQHMPNFASDKYFDNMPRIREWIGTTLGKL